jgi:bifunctional non-homologous end joining protein LigD
MKLLQTARRTGKLPAPRGAMPALIAPMLATLSPRLPAKPSDYSFEYKWDGVRAIVRWDGHDLFMQSRNQLDITARYPELWPIAKVFGSRQVMLDGEVIALDDNQRPSFVNLQRRMHVQNAAAIRGLMKQVPVFFVIFDILWLDGRPLLELPWIERRDRLEELELDGPAWLRSPAHTGAGSDLLSAARQMQLEGIVAKKLDSIYRPGVRSPDWLKIKIVSDDEFVIGGWVPEAGTRTNRIGSLLIGYYDDDHQLRFAGGVGTGFNDDAHQRLTQLLGPLATSKSPFADVVPKRGAQFVKPRLVAQIEYRRKGPGGVLHQAAFKGLRTDKTAKDLGR